MENKKARVLAICTNAWNDHGSIHTLIDIFSRWDADKTFQIYTKTDLPNTKVCNSFFQINESKVMKSIVKRKLKTGRKVFNTSNINEEEMKNIDEEHSRYNHFRQKNSWFLRLCREIVWKFGKWKTKELDDYIKEVNPDILFVPIYPTIYMGRIQNYIQKKYKLPSVTYLADDNYSYKTCGWNIFAYIHRFFLRRQVRKLVKNSDQLFVIVDKQKEDHDRVFKVNSKILTKGIDTTNLAFVKKEHPLPLKMIYTGKLVIGRDKTIVEIAKAVHKINKEGIKITLDVYSPDTPNDKYLEILNRNGCSFKGFAPLDEIASIQSKADILIFAESLEKKYKNVARLSFSTKITDYLKSGKCILAVGPSHIAPIEYIRKYNSGIICNDIESIERVLHEVIDNPTLLDMYGKNAVETAIANHSEETQRAVFINTLNAIYEKHYENS